MVRQNLVRIVRKRELGFLVPSPFCFPCLSFSPPPQYLPSLPFNSQASHTSVSLPHPSHSPEPGIFYQILRAVLVPGFCISILSSLVWDALRVHRKNGCPGKLQLWVMGSRKEMLNSTPRHQSSHSLTAAKLTQDPGTGDI